MWVIYKKDQRKIIGLTALCDKDPNKKAAIKEIVKGSIKPGRLSEYDAIQVTEREKAREYIEAFPNRLVLTGKAKKPRLTIRVPEVLSLFIKIDAPDKHPVDGIPEIPADGVSSTLITIQKIDERSKPQRGARDNDQLYLRTDHGIIRNSDGNKDINSIRLRKGEAKIRLFSEKVKRVATLQIISANPNLRDKILRIEFI